MEALGQQLCEWSQARCRFALCNHERRCFEIGAGRGVVDVGAGLSQYACVCAVDMTSRQRSERCREHRDEDVGLAHHSLYGAVADAKRGAELGGDRAVGHLGVES